VSSSQTASNYALEPATRESLPVLAVLRRRAWIVLVVALLAGAAAAAFAYANRNDYASTAKLLFRQTNSQEVQALGLLPGSPDADNLSNNNVEVVDSRRVADATSEELRSLGRDLSPEDVDEKITVSTKKDTDIVNIAATDTSARRAAQLATIYARMAAEIANGDQKVLARRILRNMVAQLDELPSHQRFIGAGARIRNTIERLRPIAEVGPGSPIMIQSGFVPTTKIGNPTRTIVLGVLFGVVLGIGLALLREQADRRLHRPEEVSAAFDAPVLTTVPRSRALKRNVPFKNLPTEVAEAFRMLQMNLRFARKKPVRSLIVTSSRSGEGKTTVAWNLASAAVTGGVSVVLVEADMRRPTLAERYELEPEPGLSEALQGEITITEAMQPVVPLELANRNGNQRYLQVLVAGGRPPDPWALMQSDAMGRLLDVLKQHHDLVVVDTPPIPHVADAISLLRHVDGVLVAASVNSTRGPEARRLRDQLASLDAHVLGVVANGGTPVSGYGYAPAPPDGGAQAAEGNGARPAGTPAEPQSPTGGEPQSPSGGEKRD
jgi:succinoglycan biosynthesis transport protein ExoP